MASELLTNPTDRTPLIAMGFSIGTVFAVHAARTNAVNGMILMAPIPSAVETIAALRHRLPFYIRMFLKLEPDKTLMNPDFQPVNMIRETTVPVLVIHGENDTIVPASLGRKLYEASSSGQKKWILIPDVGHNDLSVDTPAVSEALTTYIHSILIHF